MNSQQRHNQRRLRNSWNLRGIHSPNMQQVMAAVAKAESEEAAIAKDVEEEKRRADAYIKRHKQEAS
jgi:hypothetical protein